MPVTNVQNGGSSHAERMPEPARWGDNSIARPTSQAYRDNFDAIFGKKTYQAKDVKISIAGQELTGYAEDTEIVIMRDQD